MENLNLDQLFSLIKLHYEEKKDIKVLKEFLQIHHHLMIVIKMMIIFQNLKKQPKE